MRSFETRASRKSRLNQSRQSRRLRDRAMPKGCILSDHLSAIARGQAPTPEGLRPTQSVDRWHVHRAGAPANATAGPHPRLPFGMSWRWSGEGSPQLTVPITSNASGLCQTPSAGHTGVRESRGGQPLLFGRCPSVPQTTARLPGATRTLKCRSTRHVERKHGPDKELPSEWALRRFGIVGTIPTTSVRASQLGCGKPVKVVQR
jgi:hypothetical protein